MTRRLVTTATFVLVLVACGSTGDGSENAAPSSAAPPSTTAEVGATTSVGPTTIPLVTVPGAVRAAPTTTAGDASSEAATSTTAGGAQQTPEAPTPSESSSSTSQPAAVAPPPADIESPDDVDDFLESQPTIPPPEGEGTAIRADIGPLTGLSPGDVVTIDAANLPPGQYMAWGQCNEAGVQGSNVFALLEACVSWGFDNVDDTGTTIQTVTAQEFAGGTDCRVETCYVGIIVLPGTDGFRAYEPISFAS